MASLENFRLVVFRTVAEQRSFRKAAEQLYLTQPAVSLQIKALEEELGVQLFDRTGSRILLTAAGQALLVYARQAGALLAEAEERVTALGGEHAGRLAIGASTTIAQYVLPRLLVQFLQRNARVRPTLVSGNTEQIVEAVLEHRIALGFIEGPAHHRDIKVEPFLADELVLILPVAHAWAERTSIEGAELAALPFLMRERGSGTRGVIEQALERLHVRRASLNVVMELDSTEAIKSAVDAGLGAGFVSRWAIAQDQRTGASFRIVPIEGLRIRRNFHLAYTASPPLQGLAAEFRGFLLEQAAKRSAQAPTVRKQKRSEP